MFLWNFSIIICVSNAIIVYALEVHDEIFNSNYSDRYRSSNSGACGLPADHIVDLPVDPAKSGAHTRYFRNHTSHRHANDCCRDAKRSYANTIAANGHSANEYTVPYEYTRANSHHSFLL